MVRFTFNFIKVRALTYTKKKKGIATTKLTETAAKNFLRDLLINKQKRIQIWTGSRTSWHLSRQASPGNLQQVEDFLFSSVAMTTAPVVIAVKYSSVADTNVI